METGLVDVQSEDDIHERNCLHQAAIYEKPFVLEYGVAKGVSVDRTDVYGRIPLHYASMHGRLDMLDALLQGEQMRCQSIISTLTDHSKPPDCRRG
jgi:CDK inhibitor PHO81